MNDKKEKLIKRVFLLIFLLEIITFPYLLFEINKEGFMYHCSELGCRKNSPLLQKIEEQTSLLTNIYYTTTLALLIIRSFLLYNYKNKDQQLITKITMIILIAEVILNFLLFKNVEPTMYEHELEAIQTINVKFSIIYLVTLLFGEVFIFAFKEEQDEEDKKE